MADNGTTNYVQYDSTGTIVGSGFCPTSDFSLQKGPTGGGVLQVTTAVYPPQWASWNVVDGVLTAVG